jgi:hypothetical protein
LSIPVLRFDATQSGTTLKNHMDKIAVRHEIFESVEQPDVSGVDWTRIPRNIFDECANMPRNARGGTPSQSAARGDSGVRKELRETDIIIVGAPHDAGCYNVVRGAGCARQVHNACAVFGIERTGDGRYYHDYDFCWKLV